MISNFILNLKLFLNSIEGDGDANLGRESGGVTRTHREVAAKNEQWKTEVNCNMDAEEGAEGDQAADTAARGCLGAASGVADGVNMPRDSRGHGGRELARNARTSGWRGLAKTVEALDEHAH